MSRLSICRERRQRYVFLTLTSQSSQADGNEGERIRGKEKAGYDVVGKLVDRAMTGSFRDKDLNPS